MEELWKNNRQTMDKQWKIFKNMEIYKKQLKNIRDMEQL